MSTTPGITINEGVAPTPPAPPAQSLAACLIVTTRGPVGIPVVVRSRAEFVQKFGYGIVPPVDTPPNNSLYPYYGWMSAWVMLGFVDQLTIVRVSPSGAIKADYTVSGVGTGTAAIAATGTITLPGSAIPADGDLVEIAPTAARVDLAAKANGTNQNQAITTAISSSVLVATGMSGGTSSTPAVGNIRFYAQPSTGNTVTISDGSVTKVFEFTNTSPSGSNVAVGIGASIYATAANLATIITGLGSGFGIGASNAVTPTIFEYDSNGSYTSGHIPVLIDTGSSLNCMVYLIAAINANSTALGLTVANTTVTVPQATLTRTVAGKPGNAPIIVTGSALACTGMTTGADAIAGSVQAACLFQAYSPGSDGNNMRLDIAATTVYGASAGNFDLTILTDIGDGAGYQLREKFLNLSLATGSRNVSTILSKGKTGVVAASQYLRATVQSGAGVIAAGTYYLGQSGGTVGVDAWNTIAAADFLGDVTATPPTGLYALADPNTSQWRHICVPGIYNASVINAVAAMTATRHTADYQIDPPFGLTLAQVIAWHNGTGANYGIDGAPVSPINSASSGLTWGWQLFSHPYTGDSYWLPPSAFEIARFGYNANSTLPFRAIDGVNGDLSVVGSIGTEHSPSPTEIATLFAEPNRINPVVLQGGVPCVLGNLTMLRADPNTVTCHLNTVRAFNRAKELVLGVAQQYRGGYSDPVIWADFQRDANNSLEQLVPSAIAQAQVICDNTTNSVQDQQAQKMRAKIKLQERPNATAIILDFTYYAAGASFQTAGSAIS